MSALEQEIIERLKHLSEKAKLHILEAVKHAEQDNEGGFYGDGDSIFIIQEGDLSGQRWLDELEIVRQKLAQDQITGDYPSVVEILREIRDEES